jgi:hypothetical protein
MSLFEALVSYGTRQNNKQQTAGQLNLFVSLTGVRSLTAIRPYLMAKHKE